VSELIVVSVDSVAVSVPRGVSVAAALTEGGTHAWRRTRRGDEPRGLFCGIGVCFDCLVTLNGRSGVRACLVDVAPGDAVVTDQGPDHA
jgi:hypothetical protein